MNADDYIQQAIASMNKGDWNTAITQLKLAEKIDPNNAYIQMFFFSNYCEIGDYRLARKHYETLRKLDPEIASQLPISDFQREKLGLESETAPGIQLIIPDHPQEDLSQPVTPKNPPCPRCHSENRKSLLVCAECGQINRAALLTYIFLACAGMAIGLTGILGLDKPAGPSSVFEIIKIIFCGLPGLFFAGSVIIELARRSKSRNWQARHAQEMEKLMGYFEQNPTATCTQAGKFMTRSSEWVGAMLTDLEAEGKIRRSDDRVDVVHQ